MQLLRNVQDGQLTPDAAVDLLRWQPIETVGDFAQVDHHRGLRQGMPEFVLAQSKTPEQTAAIMAALVAKNGVALASRATELHFEAVKVVVPEAVYHPVARLITVGTMPTV